MSSSGRGGGRLLSGNLGDGVRPAPGNLYPISDQNMGDPWDFPFPYFRLNPKFHTLFQTIPLPNFLCLRKLL